MKIRNQRPQSINHFAFIYRKKILRTQLIKKCSLEPSRVFQSHSCRSPTIKNYTLQYRKTISNTPTLAPIPQLFIYRGLRKSEQYVGSWFRCLYRNKKRRESGAVSKWWFRSHSIWYVNCSSLPVYTSQIQIQTILIL